MDLQPQDTFRNEPARMEPGLGWDLRIAVAQLLLDADAESHTQISTKSQKPTYATTHPRK